MMRDPTQIQPLNQLSIQSQTSQQPSAQQLDFEDLSIMDKLNEGRFAVLRGQSKLINSPLAIKLFPYHNQKPHPSFHAERALARLNHPNIIKCFGICESIEVCFEEYSSLASVVVTEEAIFGDIVSMLHQNPILNEKLVRTLFLDMLNGVEYLHYQGIAHLDIKPENLVIGSDFNLKLIDFDLCYQEGDESLQGNGTKNYRAPELRDYSCENPDLADIYSMGVILFCLKSEGLCPHLEDEQVLSFNFEENLYSNPERFWKKHITLQGKTNLFWSPELKILIQALLAKNPEDRPSIDQIRGFDWMKGPVYEGEEKKQAIAEWLSIKDQIQQEQQQPSSSASDILDVKCNE